MNPPQGAEAIFSMVRLAGLHIPSRHRIHMAFAAYYDGSGKRDLPAMTLTGVAASEKAWPDFEQAWAEALDAHEVPDRAFSMADLMSGHKRFNGWTDASRQSLLFALYNALGSCSEGLRAYSCTIFFDAYDQAKLLVPEMRRPEAICVNFCVGGLRLTEEQLHSEAKPIILYFDRKERFLHAVNRVWLKGKKRATGWPSRVRNIIPVDSSYYPVQAADMLAWTVNKAGMQAKLHGRPQPTNFLDADWLGDDHNMLFLQSALAIPHRMRCYDEAVQIVERYPDG